MNGRWRTGAGSELELDAWACMYKRATLARLCRLVMATIGLYQLPPARICSSSMSLQSFSAIHDALPSPNRFDPAVHLAYQPPAERLEMSDLGLSHVNAPVSTAIVK